MCASLCVHAILLLRFRSLGWPCGIREIQVVIQTRLRLDMPYALDLRLLGPVNDFAKRGCRMLFYSPMPPPGTSRDRSGRLSLHPSGPPGRIRTSSTDYKQPVPETRTGKACALDHQIFLIGRYPHNKVPGLCAQFLRRWFRSIDWPILVILGSFPHVPGSVETGEVSSHLVSSRLHRCRPPLGPIEGTMKKKTKTSQEDRKSLMRPNRKGE